jgi:Mor family transcriptional regulator
MEMLYDTPYPTEPKNDLPEKTQRNAEICVRYAGSETLDSLASAYHISVQRVDQIIRGRRK